MITLARQKVHIIKEELVQKKRGRKEATEEKGQGRQRRRKGKGAETRRER